LETHTEDLVQQLGSTPTLEMVAALAGVSRSTVSRVVNGSPRVTSEAVQVVNHAISELNYVPNRAARALASRKTLAIALVIPEDTAKFFADPFFASAVQGIAMHLATTDYTLSMLIASETDPGKTQRYLQGGNVDGALILSHHRHDRSYAHLATTIPVVFGGRPVSPNRTDSYVVDVDNIESAIVATRYLIDHGRTHIATIAGRQDMAAGLDRIEGWRRALDAAGLAADLHEVGDFTPPGGAAAMARLLERGVPFDAVFIASDQMASGAMGVLREHGISVPQDVAVVGFDNDYFSTTSTPPLTTMAQPSLALGSRMAEILVRLISGGEADRLTIMPTVLVERESV
jgi:DNA-binding LacI/PurR family transcriptional regulator